MRPNKANVFLHDRKVGVIRRIHEGYQFQYNNAYLDLPDALPVSLTLPLTDKPYESKTLFPFFLGLLPEGWLLNLTCKTLKIDPENAFDILLATCRDCIGAVGIVPINGENTL